MEKHRADMVMTVPAMTTHSRNQGPCGNRARGYAGDGLPALMRQANMKGGNDERTGEADPGDIEKGDAVDE